MVQLEVVSGKQAGTVWVARRFPVRVGRSPAADLRLEDDGVWQEHLELRLDPAEGVVLTVHPQAVTSVNGQPVEHAILRHGDTVEAGSARLRFWLSPTRQRRLWLRQAVPWALLVLVCLAQVFLIDWLLQ